jgi:hypothetical protein
MSIAGNLNLSEEHRHRLTSIVGCIDSATEEGYFMIDIRSAWPPEFHTFSRVITIWQYTLLLFSILLIASRLNAQQSGTDSATTRFPEAEFAASSVFRSADYVQPLWKEFHFEGDYFGGDENDVGYTGGSWQFRMNKLQLSPGFGVTFGGNGFRTMPGFSFRWAYEKDWFVTEGLIVQGLLDTPRSPEDTPEAREEGTVRPTITDGDHVSVRWRRLTAGGAWERIQFREIEWKGGGRVAFRIFPHLSAVIFVLGPSTEFRPGLILHPAEEK